MEVPYGVGVAARAGPESCTVTGNGGGEALTGDRAGRVLSRENTYSGRPRPWSGAEGSTGRVAMARRVEQQHGNRGS
jgi:hypothetical protein